MKILKGLILLGLVSWGLVGAFRHDSLNFLSGANLLFHEAGHPIFGMLGEWAGILGGTLMQLLLPILVTVYFMREGNRFAASFGFFWIGVNLFDISVYVKDARSMALPYVGGDIHDWNYLLSRAGLLDWDHAFAGFFWLAGFILVLSAAFLGLVSLFRESSSSPES